MCARISIISLGSAFGQVFYHFSQSSSCEVGDAPLRKPPHLNRGGSFIGDTFFAPPPLGCAVGKEGDITRSPSRGGQICLPARRALLGVARIILFFSGGDIINIDGQQMIPLFITKSCSLGRNPPDDGFNGWIQA